MLFDKSKKNKYGFTIIELLVSASIIAIISGMAVSNFRGSTQKMTLDNEAERIISVIRKAHINSLVGQTVNGTRPPGGFGVEINNCGKQRNACLQQNTPCNVWECEQYYCNEYSCNQYSCNEYNCETYSCNEYNCETYSCNEYNCETYDQVCSSGDVRGIAACYNPFTGCSGQVNWNTFQCCCDGTWQQGNCITYGTTCIDPGPCESYGTTCIDPGPCIDWSTNCIDWSTNCEIYSDTNCAVWGDTVCTLYGTYDFGDCNYKLYADQDQDYIYDSGVNDSTVEDIRTIEDSIFLKTTSGSSLYITFVPPYGQIYINGSDTLEDTSFILGFEDTDYEKTITINRQTGQIEVQ